VLEEALAVHGTWLNGVRRKHEDHIVLEPKVQGLIMGAAQEFHLQPLLTIISS